MTNPTTPEAAALATDKVREALTCARAAELKRLADECARLEQSWRAVRTTGIWATITIDRDAVCDVLHRVSNALTTPQPAPAEQAAEPSKVEAATSCMECNDPKCAGNCGTDDGMHQHYNGGW